MAEHEPFASLAAASIDFELSPTEASRLSEHLAHCSACRRVASELAADARALRRLADGAPSERVRTTVLSTAMGRARPRHRPLALLAAALVVVLAVAGGMSVGSYLLAIRGPSDGTRSTPDWTRLAAGSGFPSGEGPSEVLGLAATPGVPGVGLIAVGTGATGGRVWLSPDGRSWTPVADSPALARARLQAVAAAGDRIVVAGSRVDALGDPIAATWLSPDGVSWTRTDLPGSTGLLAIAASPSRIVVAGSPRAGAAPGDPGAPIWASSDGSHWLPLDAAPFAGATVTGLTVGGPGFVAVGYDDRGGAVWTSFDGIAWSRDGDPTTFDQARVMAVSEAPGGLVAVGFDATGPLVWSSVDGRSWVRVGGIDPAGGRMLAVASTPFGVVAVGEGRAGTGAWASADGRSWQPLVDPAWADRDDVTAIVAHGDLVVAGGRVGSRSAVWVGRPSSAAGI